MGEVRERSDLFKDIAQGLIKTESELAYIWLKSLILRATRQNQIKVE